MENESIARGTALLDMFSAQLSSAKSQGQFKHDPHTNRLIGYAEGLVRGASPQQIVAYLMDIESRFVQGHQNRDVTLRFEVLSTINDHHWLPKVHCNSLTCRHGMRHHPPPNAVIVMVENPST